MIDHPAIAFLAFAAAGCVKGALGLGLPTVAMGLLTTIMSPSKAAALLIVPSMVTNLWQLATGPSFGEIATRLWPMMLAIVLGTLVAAPFTRDANAQATIALGVLLMIYAGIGLSQIRFSAPSRFEWWLGPAVGFLTGLLTAATGVFVIPAVPYLAALGLNKDELFQALGLSFTVSTVALAAALAFSGNFAPGDVVASSVALVPAMIGMAAGSWVRGRVSEPVFRRFFFIGLLVLGAHLSSAAIP